MNQFRKIISAALVLTMTLATFGATTVSASTTKDMESAYNNGESAKKIDSQYTIYSIEDNGEFYKSKTSISIPSKLGSKVITRIGDGSGSVFGNGGSDKNIYTPSSITLIANNAFGRSSIKRISMEEGVKEIGESAFYNCSSLASVSLANSITKMGVEAFKGASSLKRITMPSSLTKIPDNAFSDCSDLESVSLSNVTTIGDSAFSGCDSLEDITIPATVTKIGYDAFDEDITIKGYRNSAAEKYAKDNDIDFTALGTSSGSVSLSTTGLSVSTGGSVNFTVNNPNNRFNVTPSNSSVAIASSISGNTVTVYGVSAGTTTLTVSASGYSSATITVTVGSSGTSGTSGSYIELDTNAYSFNVGNVYYILARTNSATVPAWTSSNSNIVSVQYQADRSNRSDLRRGYSHAYLYQIRGTGTGSANITIGSSATLPVAVATSAYGSVVPDKTANFGLSKGGYYEFRMTVSNTSNAPSFTVGNGSVLKTYYVGKAGDNVYVYRVYAVGSAGQRTGIYTKLPNDKTVLHCEGTISQG